ncbi:MAG: GHMP kinase [Gallionellaceae bacterium]|nr:GHMP kinase [Gallionellaceae bacterium]
MTPTACFSTTVRAPARLHMGFLDLNGSLGRCFGSLGLALEELATEVTAWGDERIRADGPQSQRVEAFARATLEGMGIKSGARLLVRQAIPEHAGLGSGTQLALAVGTALARLYGVERSPRALASSLHRGHRSGIGLGLFERGGFVVDGGRGDQDVPPTVTANLEFPPNWRLLLILDPAHRGLHGDAEKQAFAALPRFSESQAGQLCRLALMQAMPALAEKDIASFGAAISGIQAVVGDHFAPVQGGRYASARVTRALAFCAGNGAAGVGQSSWGPTGFALTGSETQAHSLARAARHAFAGGGLEFMVCTGRNRGAEIDFEPCTSRATA